MQCSARLGVPTPLRFYKREWARCRPHLPKSVSLPIFKLLPNDRPIFTCLQCGFINTLIPICLWCSWTSEAAQREFERLTPRARRASTPPKIVRTLDQQGTVNVISEPIKRQANRYNTCLADDPTLRCVSQEQEQDCLSNKSLSQMKSHVLRSHRDRSLFTTSKATVTDFYVANATSCDILISRSCTPISERCSSRDSEDSLSEKPQRPSWLGRSQPKSIASSVNFPCPFHKLRNSLSTGVDRRAPMHLIKTISTKSLRSARILIDFETLPEFHVPLKSIVGDSDNTPQAPRTPKTLRRKKRLPFYRRYTPRPDSSASSTFNPSSLTVVSWRQSICAGEDYISNFGCETRLQSQAHASSCSQPTNITRIGHPSRPLYTAIRPNMFPVKLTNDTSTHSYTSRIPHSSRPISLRTPHRVPSPGITSSTSALDNDGVNVEPLNYQSRPLSRYSHGSVLPSAFGLTSRHDPTGFSLSGETELRMALAKAGCDEGHNVFRFKVTTGKKLDFFSVIKRFRELKKGFKNLVVRSHYR